MYMYIYSIQFNALQSSGIQFFLPKNKDKKLVATNIINEYNKHFQL